MSVIAVIPARGGSVRIPGKNMKSFHGRPIIEYSIETAQKCGLFELIAVSTDDAQIEQIALEIGAVVVPRLFDDGARGTQEIAANVLENFPEYEQACVIYATCPMLEPTDIWALQRAAGDDGYAMTVGPDGADAGCAYWGRADLFRRGVPLEGNTTKITLPVERVCDINTNEDWIRAELMYDALRRAE